MKTNAVKFACKTLGAIHFVAQTTADIVLNAEGNLAEKHLGHSKQETMQHRIDKTNSHQQKLVNMYAKQAAKLSKAK